MLDEVEDDPSLSNSHITAIRNRIKQNQMVRLEQKKNTDGKADGEEQETKKMTHEEKQMLIEGSVARGDQSDLELDEVMDEYTEDDLIPQYPGRKLDPRGVQSILSKRVNNGMQSL